MYHITTALQNRHASSSVALATGPPYANCDWRKRITANGGRQHYDVRCYAASWQKCVSCYDGLRYNVKISGGNYDVSSHGRDFNHSPRHVGSSLYCSSPPEQTGVNGHPRRAVFFFLRLPAKTSSLSWYKRNEKHPQRHCRTRVRLHVGRNGEEHVACKAFVDCTFTAQQQQIRKGVVNIHG